MIINSDDYNILIPFGPFIYESMLTEKELRFVQTLANKSLVFNQDASSTLVGNIRKQLKVLYNESDSTRFTELIHPHLINYLKVNNTSIDELNLDGAQHQQNLVPDYNNLQYNFGIGPWINYMKQHEFNPLHAHSGTFSGIIMIDVPEEISEEYNTYPMNTNMRCPGELQWVQGDYKLNVTPKTGKLYLFPSFLKHQVYPFESNVTRITMSWNIFDLDFTYRDKL
jgi:hypothetical protein